jgi:hypothetical protein
MTIEFGDASALVEECPPVNCIPISQAAQDVRFVGTEFSDKGFGEHLAWTVEHKLITIFFEDYPI